MRNRSFQLRKKIILLFILLPVLLIAQAEKKQDVWEPVKFLLGKWEGQGEGKSGISKVWKEWHFILDGKFLHMKTKAVFEPQEKNPKGETHEDLGYFSYDGVGKQIVFRQFHVEGFIIQYVLESISDDGKTLTFAAEMIENGPPGLHLFLGSLSSSRNHARSPPDGFLTRLPDFQRNCHGNRDAYSAKNRFAVIAGSSVN